jgi:hypothetical protein
MINGEVCGNDCGVFYSTPESARTDNPLKIPAGTFYHSADLLVTSTSYIHLPLLVNDPSQTVSTGNHPTISSDKVKISNKNVPSNQGNKR